MKNAEILARILNCHSCGCQFEPDDTDPSGDTIAVIAICDGHLPQLRSEIRSAARRLLWMDEEATQ